MEDLLGGDRLRVPDLIHGRPVATAPDGVDEGEAVEVRELELPAQDGRDAAEDLRVLVGQRARRDPQQVEQPELPRRPVVHHGRGVALHEGLLGEDRVRAVELLDAAALEVEGRILERVAVLVGDDDRFEAADPLGRSDEREGRGPRVVVGEGLAVVQREDQLGEVVLGIEEAETREGIVLGGHVGIAVLGPEERFQLGEEGVVVDDPVRDAIGRREPADGMDLVDDLADRPSHLPGEARRQRVGLRGGDRLGGR